MERLVTLRLAIATFMTVTLLSCGSAASVTDGIPGTTTTRVEATSTGSECRRFLESVAPIQADAGLQQFAYKVTLDLAASGDIDIGRAADELFLQADAIRDAITKTEALDDPPPQIGAEARQWVRAMELFADGMEAHSRALRNQDANFNLDRFEAEQDAALLIIDEALVLLEATDLDEESLCNG